MGYFSLLQNNKKVIIKNSKQVSLLIGISSDQMLVFFADNSFHHIQLSSQSIICQGILTFTPSNFIPFPSQLTCKPQQSYTILLKCPCSLNLNKFYLKSLTITKQQKYQYFEDDVELGEFDASDLFWTVRNQRQKDCLVWVKPNVQNGLLIKAYDIENKVPVQDLLYLSNKYMNPLQVTIKHHNQNPKQWQLCFIANGEKFQSLHFARIFIEHTNQKKQSELLDSSMDKSLMDDSSMQNPYKKNINQQKQEAIYSRNMKMHFTCLKQIQLLKNFTALGCSITYDNHLHIIGNSSSFSTPQQQNQQQQICCISISLDLMTQSHILKQVPRRMFNLNLGKGVLIRRFIARDQDGDMVVLLQCGVRKYLYRIILRSVQKTKLNNQLIFELDKDFAKNKYQFQITLDSQAIYSYHMVCPKLFFQKHKDTSALISFNNLNIIDKKTYQTYLLNQLLKETDTKDLLIQQVIDLL